MALPDPIRPPARVAFIGLGVMGAAMAANIGRAVFALSVHNRSRPKAATLEEAGAAWAATPAEAARGAAASALCLPDTPDVEAVLFGPGGVAAGVQRGAVVVDFSTVAAAPTAAFARRLGEERGASLLDSPVAAAPAARVTARSPAWWAATPPPSRPPRPCSLRSAAR